MWVGLRKPSLRVDEYVGLLTQHTIPLTSRPLPVDLPPPSLTVVIVAVVSTVVMVVVSAGVRV